MTWYQSHNNYFQQPKSRKMTIDNKIKFLETYKIMMQ